MITYVFNPDLPLICKCIEAINSGIASGVWPYLTRNRSVEIDMAGAWLSKQNENEELRVVGIDSLGLPVVISHLSRMYGRASHSARFAITVHPSWERSGVGANVCNLLFDKAKQVGITRIEALPVEANFRAVNFLLKNGFVKEGVANKRFLTEDGVYENCFYMAKFID